MIARQEEARISEVNAPPHCRWNFTNSLYGWFYLCAQTSSLDTWSAMRPTTACTRLFTIALRLFAQTGHDTTALEEEDSRKTTPTCELVHFEVKRSYLPPLFFALTCFLFATQTGAKLNPTTFVKEDGALKMFDSFKFSASPQVCDPATAP
eukprot:7383449-Prymnesium_polylepis.1